MIFQNFGFNQNYPVAAPAPPAAQPILWVDAGNASSYNGSGTTWYDLSTNGNNLTIAGSPTWDSTTGSFSFPNNTSKYAYNNALSNANVGTGNCSTLVWERYQGPNDDTYYFPYEWGQMDGSNYDLGGLLAFYADAGLGRGLYERAGGIRLQYIIPAFGDSVSYNKTTDYNVWRQVVITRDGSNGNVKMYVDGSLYKTITGLYSGNINQYDKINVGSSNPSNPFGGQLPFYGDIAILQIWDKVLTSTDVSDNYNTYKTRFGK